MSKIIVEKEFHVRILKESTKTYEMRYGRKSIIRIELGSTRLESLSNLLDI